MPVLSRKFSNKSVRNRFYINLISVILSFLLVTLYGFLMGWHIDEFVHVILGLFLLWAPTTTVIYYALQHEVTDQIVRFTFSAIASYALVTLVFTGLAELHLNIVFYALQALFAVLAIVWTIRRKSWRTAQQLMRLENGFNGLLLLILAATLISVVDYQRAFVTSADGTTEAYVLYPDLSFAASQSYQLARGIPETQAATRAGTPERAYHFLSHITTMLIAQYTQQDDMLRALTAYHYTIIEILIALGLYSLVKTLTGSLWAGYTSIALMYIVIVFLPPFVNTKVPYFYFTIFPQVVNGLWPTTFSPQMYSALAIMYGGLLGFLLITKRTEYTNPDRTLLLITALIMASLLRFNIHFGLVMLPGFIVISILIGWHKRQWIYIVAASLALLVGVLLYLETKLPVYLKDTSIITIGYNGLTDLNSGAFWVSTFKAWPGSDSIYQTLAAIILNADVLKWVWQVVELTAFTLLNIVGIPLCVATVIYLSNKHVRQNFAWFGLFLGLLTVGSILVAIFVFMPSDRFSVPGEILFHVRWYVFPLMAGTLWLIFKSAQKRFRIRNKLIFKLIGFELCSLFAVGHLYGTWTDYNTFHGVGPVLDRDAQAMILYIHNNTPKDAVIFNAYNVTETQFPYSGIAGRAAYMESVGNTFDLYARTVYPNDDRIARIQTIWSTPDTATFCKLLLETPSTYVVEYAAQPFVAQQPPCLQSDWLSPKGEITLYRIGR